MHDSVHISYLTPLSRRRQKAAEAQAEEPTGDGSGALDDEEEACIAQELEREGWLVPTSLEQPDPDAGAAAAQTPCGVADQFTVPSWG